MTETLLMGVPLRVDTVRKLLELSGHTGQPIHEIVDDLASQRTPADSQPSTPRSRAGLSARGSGPYELDVLGERSRHTSLGELWLAALKKLCDLDPGLAERLATKQARSRRYVSRARENIYPLKPHLLRYTVEFVSGWWAGTNNSRRDTERALRIACVEVGLAYGIDLKATL